MSAEAENSVLVFDVGGSHSSAAVCRRAAGTYQLGLVVSAPQPTEESSVAFFDLLHTLGVKASDGFGAVAGAQLAVPGPFDLEAGLSRMKHKLPYLCGVQLRQPLAERFGWQPSQVRFVNDAAAFLLGESGAGAAQGIARAVGLALGTGIGSAFAVDGRVVCEGPGIPPGGEIWNFPYRGGIVEDFVSTRAIQADYQRHTGALRSVAELATAAASDAAAAEVFADFGRELGSALHPALAAFAPDVVVLGGGISRSAHLFLPAAERELQDLPLQLRVSALFDHAALIGAGVAWFTGASFIQHDDKLQEG